MRAEHRSGSVFILLAFLVALALLAVPGTAGNSVTISGEIHAAPAPVAAFSGSPLFGSAPLTVAFSDQSTGSITSWAWDFDNNGVVNSNIPNPSYTYATVGTYTVKLTVTGPGGSDDEVKPNYITVTAPVKPVAAFSATPTSGYVPLTVQFTDQSRNNPTSWKWEYRKPSGSWTQFSTAKDPAFTFTETGMYSIRFTAANAAGSNTLTKNNFITVVTPPKPVAEFTATPTSGNAPLFVQFTDQSSNNPTSWKWEYRKGTGGWTQFSTEQHPSYTFTAIGTYGIRLTVANAAGSHAQTRAQYITVTPLRKPIALFSQDKVAGRVPLTVSFTDRSLFNPTEYLWTFGDGTTSEEKSPVHTYTRTGIFTVQLKASNAAGSDTARRMVIVMNAPWWFQ